MCSENGERERGRPLFLMEETGYGSSMQDPEWPWEDNRENQSWQGEGASGKDPAKAGSSHSSFPGR